MFLGENARGQRVLIVFRQYRHCLLHHDHAVVQLFVDKVHGAAGDRDSIFEGLALRIQTWKCREK